MKMKINKSFVKRRWLDFRSGHSTYLIFAVQFVQFIIISYGLYVDQSDFLKSLFPTMYHWMSFFLLTYVPSAVFMGHMHIKKQLPTEQAKQAEHNPYKDKALEGKETLYTLRLNRINYDIQLENMRIHNATADELNRKLGSQIPKYSETFFMQVLENKKFTHLLEQGEDVHNIEFKEYDLGASRSQDN